MVASLPNSPSVGDTTVVGGRTLQWNGEGWQSLISGLGPVIGVQIFGPGSGNYVPTAGAVAALGFAQAGGGGGGGVGTTSGYNAYGGGGAPGETRAFVLNPILGSYPYSVGAKGTGAAAGNNTGNTGSDTTFGAAGAICIAKGGTGGTGVAGTTDQMGNGGSTPAGSGGIVIPPLKPTPTTADPIYGFSDGGSSFFGQAAPNLSAVAKRAGGNTTTAPGNNYAVGRGAGGTGGARGGGAATTAVAGGDGGDGLLLIIEYGSPFVGGSFNSDLVDITYIGGLTLSNNAGDATNDIDVAAGRAMDKTGTKMMILAQAMTKRTDAAWSAGSGSGGLDVGSIADGTIHHYLIKNSTTGAVDLLQSLSPDRSSIVTMTIATPCVVSWADHGMQAGSRFQFPDNGGNTLPGGVSKDTDYYVIATNLTAGTFKFAATQGGAAVNSSGSQSGTHVATTAPKMPTGYDLRRRIGSLLRVSAAMTAFRQNGDCFKLVTSVTDRSAKTAQSDILIALSVPLGIKVLAMQMIFLRAYTTGTILPHLSMGDGDAATAELEVGGVRGDGTGAVCANTFTHFWTNASRQVRFSFSYEAGTSTDMEEVYVITSGWYDDRGRGRS